MHGKKVEKKTKQHDKDYVDMPRELRSFFRGHLVTPRMTVAHIIGRGVRKRTEHLQRCRWTYWHLTEYPGHVFTDVYFHL